MRYQHVAAQGQMHAAWRHKVGRKDARAIASGAYPVLLIHGRHDLLAMPKFAEQLASRLQVGSTSSGTCLLCCAVSH